MFAVCIPGLLSVTMIHYSVNFEGFNNAFLIVQCLELRVGIMHVITISPGSKMHFLVNKNAELAGRSQ